MANKRQNNPTSTQSGCSVSNDELSNSFSTTLMKKNLGKPVTVSINLNEDSPVPIPYVLRFNRKFKSSLSKHKSLNEFTLKINEEQSVPEITIGPSINLESRQSEEHNEELNTTSESLGLDETMNVDEESILLTANDIVKNDKPTPMPHFYSLRNKVICVMEPRTKFSFHGKLKIRVLYGGVKIYGSTLKRSNTCRPVEVYSPRGNKLIEIQTVTLEESSDSLSDVWKDLEKDNIDSNVLISLQSDMNNLELGGTVIILENLENHLTRFLDKYFSHKLFPRIKFWSNYSWSDVKKAEVVLQTNIYCDNTTNNKLDFTCLDETIDKILNKYEINKNIKVLVAGGKSVGKSTTMRYLVNKLLEKSEEVIVLDLDPGQAEFTTPGCVSLNIITKSLLGPNFTHLNKPFHQIFIGGVDVSRYLPAYISAVKKLIELLDEYTKTKSLPIIINTMGFTANIGGDIISSTIRSIHPTDVIQLHSRNKNNNYGIVLSDEVLNAQKDVWIPWRDSSGKNYLSNTLKYELHTVKSNAETKSSQGELWNIEPHQHRDIVMLAYLSGINKPKKNSNSSNNENNFKNINDIVPYQVPFSAVKLSLGYSATPHALAVMNGNIIALCGDNLDNVQDQSNKESSIPYPEVLIRLPLATCYGFGIVRGVDMEKKKIYVNTPISISELEHVNCLIGCMPVPSGLLQLSRFGVAYTGSDCKLPTSRETRRGYVRMKFPNDTV